MNQSTYNINYDQDLAIALGLDSDINIDFDSDSKDDKAISPIVSLVCNLVKEFQADMIELIQKFRSASAKMSALIFMPTNLLSSKNDAYDKLKFSAILIEHPDISLSCAPSPPAAVSPIQNSEDESQEREEETALIKMELKQQLLWFQEFGRHGLTRNEPTGHTEKTKRHLTLITDHVQAA